MVQCQPRLNCKYNCLWLRWSVSIILNPFLKVFTFQPFQWSSTPPTIFLLFQQIEKNSSICHRIICSVRDKGKQIQYTLFTFSEGTILIKGLTYLVAWPLILSSLSREWWWTRKKTEGFTVFQQSDLILGFLVNFWCSCSSRVSKCPLSLLTYLYIMIYVVCV